MEKTRAEKIVEEMDNKLKKSGKKPLTLKEKWDADSEQYPTKVEDDEE